MDAAGRGQRVLQEALMEKLVTLRDAAVTLSCSVDYLKRLHRAGRIRIVRLSRAVRLPESELCRLVTEGIERVRHE